MPGPTDDFANLIAAAAISDKNYNEPETEEEMMLKKRKKEELKANKTRKSIS